jgi:hypothetical protein
VAFKRKDGKLWTGQVISAPKLMHGWSNEFLFSIKEEKRV